MAKRPNGQADPHWVAARKQFCQVVWVQPELGPRKRQYFYGATKAEAAAKAKDAQRREADGQQAQNQRLTLDQFAKQWMAQTMPFGRTRGTCATYALWYRLYVRPSLGHVALVSLKPTHIQQLMSKLTAQGLSPSTCNGAKRVLGVMLRDAQINGEVDRNVAHIARGVKADAAHGRSMTPDQANQFIDHLSSVDDRLYTAVVVTLYLGLRRGELLGLHWSDIDFTAGSVKLRTQLVREREVGAAVGPMPFPEADRRTSLMLTTLKTDKSSRTLAMPKEAVAALKAWKIQQSTERLFAGPAWTQNPYWADLVFTTPIGTPVDPDNFRHRVSKATVDAGIGRWTVHELRHTAASMLFAAGLSVVEISAALGHANIRITQEIYVHLMESAKVVVADAMSRAYGR